jgi:hypothetical protein
MNINKGFTEAEMREMLDQIAAVPRKWYRGTRTWNIKHLLRYDCIMLCYLWRYRTVPTLEVFNSIDQRRLMRLFKHEMDSRGIRWKLFECKSRYNVAHDSKRYEFSGFRLLPRGIKLLLRVPTEIKK